jgi:UDPglucose 6-dehydrogenase
MRLCMIGTGYVGLVAGTCLADGGHNVICVDLEAEKIARLNQGMVPIYEPGLEEILRRNVQEKRLFFTTDLTRAVRDSRIIFIAVGTPPRPDGSADLRYLMRAVRAVGKAMNGYKIVVVKSTVPVGTAEKVRAALKISTSKKFTVVSNPEFLKEGAAVDDFLKPDRIIVGTDSAKAADIMREIYSPFNRTRPRVLVMSNRSAEMTKYAANCLLATKISFINEMANYCKLVGADINEVREGIGADSRIGYAFLFPGLGFGGSCFPKDVRALINDGKDQNFNFQVLTAVERVNDQQKKIFLPEIQRHFNNRLQGKTIAVWGLSFKPRTNDMREAPAIILIKELLKWKMTVKVYDPVATLEARTVFRDSVIYCAKNYDALQGADALIVVTERNEFQIGRAHV